MTLLGDGCMYVIKYWWMEDEIAHRQKWTELEMCFLSVKLMFSQTVFVYVHVPIVEHI